MVNQEHSRSQFQKLAIFSHLKMTSAVSQEIHFLAVDIAHQARQGFKSLADSLSHL